MKNFFNKLWKSTLMILIGLGSSLYSFFKGLTLLLFFFLAAEVIVGFMFLKGLTLNFVKGYDGVQGYLKNINFKL